MLFLGVMVLLASATASDDDERLNMFVRRFEPVYYDPELVHRNHVRAKRSIEDGESGHVHVQIRSTKRSLDLHLSADASVFHEDLVVESSTEGIVNVDTSHIYKGYVIGQPHSRVFGSLHRGVFEGSIDTGSGASLYVERARRFFNDTRPYHSVLYSSADVEIPAAAGGGSGHWCGLHGSTERWMKDMLRRFRRTSAPEPHLAHGRVGRKLHAVTKASDNDESDKNDADKIGMSQADDDGDDEWLENTTTKDGERVVGERRDATDKTEREDPDDSEDEVDTLKTLRPKGRRPSRRREDSRSRRVCNLEIIVDNTLAETVLAETATLAPAREVIASVIAHMVDKVNAIYGDTNFGGIEDINFVVQHIMIAEPGDCVGYKAKQDPLCRTSLDAPQLLYLASLTRHDDYCLSYRLNYRDFADGTLGLAWIASDKIASGGICERYRTSVELDPVNGDYKQAKLSLNTGITTLINHKQYVGLLIGALTLAHEIGHSFGSPHDKGSICEPVGAAGKFLMYESATKGDRPNNDRFSPCSIGNISAILVPVLNGQSPRENCFQRHSGPVCGNRIVEGNEQCDCGLNEAECTDKCCYPRHTQNKSLSCSLKPFARCSPTAGVCCNASCSFVPRGKLCSEATDCTEVSFCDGKRAECPKAPAKPNMTSCNKNTQVCFSGQCMGSICQKYGLEECFRGAKGLSIDELCLLTCQAHGSSECKVACSFPKMASHCGAKLQPGSPCNDMRGYCDIFHKCRLVEPRGFLTRLQGFFFGGGSVHTLYEFLAHHPIVSCLVILGSSWFMLLIFRCFAVHTPSNNPLKKPPFKLKDTLRHPIDTFVSS
ncbi:disintegrin and metalloproteinase domain-containing protein 10-like [Dermacentor albipictus]|uniref:disintegrin and metalloproteinase domain-containing protein 10-like n=1 Tax=Dermacentor albipictus TaxID=60249 RepID=UPI0031FCEC00